MQMYSESFYVVDTVTAATLALLGLTDREICDAAESGGKETTNDLLGDVTESKAAVIPEFLRVILSAFGVDITAAKAAAAAAKHPPTPPEAADALRKRRESAVSNASEGSNTDSQMSLEGFRLSDGRSSPVNHPVFMIRSQFIESSAIGAPASAIAPPPAPATQLSGGAELRHIPISSHKPGCFVHAPSWRCHAQLGRPAMNALMLLLQLIETSTKARSRQCPSEPLCMSVRAAQQSSIISAARPCSACPGEACMICRLDDGDDTGSMPTPLKPCNCFFTSHTLFCCHQNDSSPSSGRPPPPGAGGDSCSC
jgi:hypothetical protein